MRQAKEVKSEVDGPQTPLGGEEPSQELSELSRSAAPQTERRLVRPDVSAVFQGLSATVCICMFCVCVYVSVCACLHALSAWKIKNSAS